LMFIQKNEPKHKTQMHKNMKIRIKKTDLLDQNQLRQYTQTQLKMTKTIKNNNKNSTIIN
ncbi:hypothetical protein, partial [Klebsiella pneumoniae]|uniref:hypothetical protein n=1 Tax=Klebsiella pneumoniae TaxID=573 RepID=UPI00272F9809